MPDFSVTEAFVDSANPLQLHIAARGVIPADQWPASFVFVNGAWAYRVERELDTAATLVVQTAISTHIPDPLSGYDQDTVDLILLKNKTILTTADVNKAMKILLRRIV